MEQVEKDELLMDSGREVATMWLESAIRAAETADQAENQVALLRCASIHTLATCALNNPGREDEYMEELFERIRGEFAYMKTALVEGQLERVEHIIPASLPDAGLH